MRKRGDGLFFLFSYSKQAKALRKKKGVSVKAGCFLFNSHFCCNLAALNFDTLFGACWGGAMSGATSSCFLSGMVGRAGGAMVRWGTTEGIGSFSTTVPEKA